MAKKTIKKVKEKRGRNAPKTDGLGPREMARIRSAVRDVWQFSYARRLVIARCTKPDGFQYCENKKCPSKGRPVPKVTVDHIEPCGGVLDRGFLERMFTPSKNLQGLCAPCHKVKTKLDLVKIKKTREANFLKRDEDFF